MGDHTPVEIPEDVPTSARTYGWMLGGKDNFEVDRQFTIGMLEQFHSGVDITRENRRFLYRVVRYMVREAGIRQFIDMGCGLPTNNNVHQVAQAFAPGAHVVYVDNDPIVLAHGRALLTTDETTTMIQADFREQEALLAEPGLRRLIDFERPVGMLFLSVGHHLLDGDDPAGVLGEIIGRAVPGSHLAFSQMVCTRDEQRAEMNARFNAAGMGMRLRSVAEVEAILPALERVEPGLLDVKDWRPDPGQPALDPVPAELRKYVGRSALDPSIYEYGGLLRKV
ncbi:SAM-dependent methyltransferase [Spirillospora sp. NPDC029432]|uniref:SAM-dependent methyltransferase n=1 Tax=Spirillospora sp. NPDC029432 TaxID=3154599 RepID=UPI0034534CF4